ncbi:hypothetical protein Nepgr_024695 [Nepenthes gracilis]|uniref:Uncharacterized protein n=1 Tax=Nepenthes gracilis TaxID=150966 RepID=A0AAD3T510_NEPGR|nr:hypothetical protein Nepgr_024695 [Nepenthes gracilis]
MVLEITGGMGSQEKARVFKSRTSCEEGVTTASWVPLAKAVVIFEGGDTRNHRAHHASPQELSNLGAIVMHCLRSCQTRGRWRVPHREIQSKVAVRKPCHKPNNFTNLVAS